MGPSGPVGRFLGCNHVPAESHIVGDAFNPREGWTKDDPAKKDPPQLEFGKPIVIPSLSVAPSEIAGSSAPGLAGSSASGKYKGKKIRREEFSCAVCRTIH